MCIRDREIVEKVQDDHFTVILHNCGNTGHCTKAMVATGCLLYTSYEEVFKESNNWENKEALWKHRWYAGSDGHGSSNGNYKLNSNDEYFLCLSLIHIYLHWLWIKMVFVGLFCWIKELLN